ncbi:hypothetical protein AB0M58_14355 [Streptomyces bobili]|uniref:hypothetical protein n=1 Tax=Streptomyces bobili TaxID=67280 RepID=UPI00342C9E26
MIRADDGVFIPVVPTDAGTTGPGGGGGGGTSQLFNGLAPDWGPFVELNSTARTVIQVLMAGVLIYLLGRGVISFGNMKFGQSQNDPVALNQGRNNLIGSLVGAFGVASIGTLFTLVYGMGI